MDDKLFKDISKPENESLKKQYGYNLTKAVEELGKKATVEQIVKWCEENYEDYPDFVR